MSVHPGVCTHGDHMVSWPVSCPLQTSSVIGRAGSGSGNTPLATTALSWETMLHSRMPAFDATNNGKKITDTDKITDTFTTTDISPTESTKIRQNNNFLEIISIKLSRSNVRNLGLKNSHNKKLNC